MALTAEERLLLLGSRLSLRAGDHEPVAALLEGPLNWDALMASAVRHGVAPLFEHALGGAGLDTAVPVAPWTELRRLAAISRARSERLRGTLGEVLSAAAAAGVRPLGLKDLGLDLEVYRAPGLRPLGDLDLMIRPGEYDTFAAAVGELGFVARMDPDAQYARRYGWGHHFVRASDDVWVDVQWNVLQREWRDAGPRIFDPEVLYAGAHELAVPDGPAMPVPAPEAQLFHLCAHLEGHLYSELILFCDIAECLRAWEATLDWDRVVAIASRFDARATVHAVLDLAHRLLGAPLAEGALERFAGDRFRATVLPAVFGGLDRQHATLDRLHARVRPPRALMERMEAEVRDQVDRAAAVYDGVDAAVRAFAGGGGILVLDGDGEARRFPDPRLDPFGTIRLVVREQDAPRLRGLLRGAFPASGPAVVREGDAGALFGPPAARRSNRQLAVETLRRRLRRSHVPRAAVIEVHALADAELFAWLLARAGEGESAVLVALPGLLEALREQVPVARDVVAAAHRRGVAERLARGTAVLEAVEPAGVAAALRAELGALPEARVLEWAREGPEVHDAEPELGTAYLLVLAGLEARAGERGALARRAPVGAICAALLRRLPRLVRPGGDAREPAVYWTSP